MIDRYPTLQTGFDLSGSSRVSDITGLDFIGIPVVSVIRPQAKSLTVASGKGVDIKSAVTSGVMEAYEHNCAENYNPSIILAPRNAAVDDDSFVDTSNLPEDQRTGRSNIAPISWVTGYRLVDGLPLKVPYDLNHLDLTVSGLKRSDGFLISTNGFAASFDSVAAKFHAICEVVERDAIARISDARKSPVLSHRRLIDLNSIGDGDCQNLVEKCRLCGMRIDLWDITSDIGVPVLYCRLSETHSAPYNLAPPADGAGCHPNAYIAARRAITEAAQSRITLISGARDDIERRHYVPAPPRNISNLSEPGPTGRSLQATSEAGNQTDGYFLELMLTSLHRAGFHNATCVAIAEHPTAGHVVSVVVPGLEGTTLSTGYRPGRRAGKGLLEKTALHP